MLPLHKYILPTTLVLVGVIQGCSNNKIEASEATSSILAEKTSIKNAYANCVAAIPNVSKLNIVEEKRNKCEQEYQKAWEKVVQNNK